MTSARTPKHPASPLKRPACAPASPLNIAACYAELAKRFPKILAKLGDGGPPDPGGGRAAPNSG